MSDTKTNGVLPVQALREAVWQDLISSDYRIPDTNYQPASLDLRLGETAHSLQCSFLPYPVTVEERLLSLAIAEIDIRDGAVLERNRPYLIPLLESLRLPPDVQAKTNPKNSTGRLDIFTRVITDHGERFDEIPPGYQGRLYLEVFSRSFTIRVRTKLSLNQIRLFRGTPTCEPGELHRLHLAKPIVTPQDPQPDRPPVTNYGSSIGLSVDLTAAPDPIGYRAKKNSKLLDLSQTRAYHPQDFWEPVYAGREGGIILEPEEFYLLSAAERVSIPPELAAEMTAYETSSGEVRTHYAGFFDPGFGFGDDGRLGGIQPVLEVRAHDVPFMIGPAQRVCTLTFEQMTQFPDQWYGAAVGSSYQGAGRVLSKHFSQPA